MAYQKTIWVNKETPVDQTNMNKIENELEKLDNGIGELEDLATEEKGTIVGAVNELFQSVGNGKAVVASAITEKGVQTNATDTFETMANNIANIPGGGKIYQYEHKYVPPTVLKKIDIESKYNSYGKTYVSYTLGEIPYDNEGNFYVTHTITTSTNYTTRSLHKYDKEGNFVKAISSSINTSSGSNTLYYFVHPVLGYVAAIDTANRNIKLYDNNLAYITQISITSLFTTDKLPYFYTSNKRVGHNDNKIYIQDNRYAQQALYELDFINKTFKKVTTITKVYTDMFNYNGGIYGLRTQNNVIEMINVTNNIVAVSIPTVNASVYCCYGNDNIYYSDEGAKLYCYNIRNQTTTLLKDENELLGDRFAITGLVPFENHIVVTGSLAVIDTRTNEVVAYGNLENLRVDKSPYIRDLKNIIVTDLSKPYEDNDFTLKIVDLTSSYYTSK